MGQERNSLQLLIFRLGLRQYGNAGIGVLPEGNELRILSASLCLANFKDDRRR